MPYLNNGDIQRVEVITNELPQMTNRNPYEFDCNYVFNNCPCVIGDLIKQVSHELNQETMYKDNKLYQLVVLNSILLPVAFFLLSDIKKWNYFLLFGSIGGVIISFLYFLSIKRTLQYYKEFFKKRKAIREKMPTCEYSKIYNIAYEEFPTHSRVASSSILTFLSSSTLLIWGLMAVISLIYALFSGTKLLR
jgi:hypothetical protein